MSDEIAKRCQDAYNWFASIAGFEPEEYDTFQVDRYHNGIIAIVPSKSAPTDFKMAFEKAVKKVFQECVQEYNQEQERAISTHREHMKHPGMERFNTEMEFWAEVGRANEENRAGEIEELVRKCVAEALR